MKKIYKNINIPYHYYDNHVLNTGYIYNDKKYFDLNILFTDYIGTYLTYHFEINQELKEVHNLSDVVDYLLENYKTFSIPNIYIDEYAKSEYEYLTRLQNYLIQDKLDKDKPENRNNSLKFILKYPIDYLVSLELKKYKNIQIPKKIYSRILKRKIYVLYGEFYENIFDGLHYVFFGSFYYQFNGDDSESSYNHCHEHNFEDVIREIFRTFDEFIIHENQKQFFSRQELIFINKLLSKLKEDKYTSKYYKENGEDNKLLEEYKYLSDNKKYFKLLFFNIKDKYRIKKNLKMIINSHKTNK